MTEEIAAPVPVSELLTRRRPGRYHASDGYLSQAEVALAWPVVWRYDAVIEANGVSTTRAQATGSYGTITWTEYRAEDVQRVAGAIAAGTAVLEPHWRRDTPAGRAAQRRSWAEERYRRRAGRTRGLLILAGLLLGLGVVLVAALR